MNPSTVAQANTAYTGTQNSLAQQQALLGALQQQNGIQNQSNVYNQLQGVANGTGPNPAQAQLAQATGANTANQAALMAGQRGSGANAGLIARQAAMQGGANQQNAAGQAATMQANQSLNALGQLSGVAGQQVSNQAAATGAVTGAQQGEQQQILNGIAQQNNSNVGMQSNVNSANAGLASTSMQGQQALLGGGMNGAGGAAKLIGGLFANGGQVPHMAGGGYSPISVDYNNQDQVDYNNPASMSPASIPTPAPVAAPTAPQMAPGPSSFASHVNKTLGNGQPMAEASQFNYGNPGANQLAAGMSNLLNSGGGPQDKAPAAYSNANPIIAGGPQDQGMPQTDDDLMFKAAQGGKVPAKVAPGEIYLKPNQVPQVLKGADPMKIGEKIPGKAPVEGAVNSYANDIVDKTLDEGGVIVPNKQTKSKNPSKASQAFVHALAAKHGMTVMPKKVK